MSSSDRAALQANKQAGDVGADITERTRKIAGTRNPLPMSVRLYQDLQIAGDDASELLEGISRTYGTSFQGFSFSSYFPDETEACWFYLKSFFGFRDRTRKPLTLGHLIAVVEEGVWFEPAPEHA